MLLAGYLLVGIEAAARPFNADDFRHDWAAGKALVRGEDFYDGATLQRIWAESPTPGAVPGTAQYPYLNAPHYAIFVAPFSAMPFREAKVAYAVVSLLCYVAGIIVLLRTVASGWPRAWRALGVAVAVGFAPAWVAIASGQASLIVFAFLVAGFAALLHKRDALAGTLLALSAFKYTMGFLVFPYLAYRRRWKALLVAAAVASVTSLMAVARAGFDSIGSYFDTVRLAQSHGGVNSPFGPTAGSDLSLLPLTARIANQNRPLAYALYALALAVIAYVVWRVFQKGSREPSWTELAIVLLVCQLAVYHRAYDAVVVVLAGAVAVSSERIRHAPFALAIALGSVFVVANAHAPLARGSGRVRWLWDVVVLSHRTWAIVALLGVLCWSAPAERRRAAQA